MTSQPFGNLSHNWVIFLVRRVQNEQSTADFSVSIEGRSTGFRGGAFSVRPSQSSPGGKELLEGIGEGSNRYWLYTAKDGTEVTFRSEGQKDCKQKATAFNGGSEHQCMYAAKLVKPSGETYTFHYDNPTSSPYDTRLRSVTSNYGYALIFEYLGTSEKIREACVLNLATDLLPSNYVCPNGVPTASYSYHSNGFIGGATNASGTCIGTAVPTLMA